MISLPTSRSDWRLLGRTIRLVLGHPSYLVFAIVVTTAVAILISVTQNLRFVVEVLLSDSLGLGFKVEFLTAMLPFLGPQYDATHGVLIYAVAGLTGANVALLAYHLLEHDLSVEGGGGSAAGVVLGTLGAGCAACGPGILAGIVGIVGGAGLLANLPYEGLEFSMLAVVVLVLSMYWLADGMRGGEIRGCPVDPEMLRTKG
ncbi:hypothetical protein L593_09385 [Salinarchaeum sp. Harcht-Bsk1]|uniref:hypothetical protein n=1 Tax=Salinarchaeum sp. Harcht-Bsk1 TaxID=1333523 RepID=UPI0003423AD6|nr:hypothetical protein [Salinarchaeum sp. Harcht-Bsk1]AGN01822.1 hypothetical protein L593_09385 [Salinarchaeum sp. Harcht-Bsk1]